MELSLNPSFTITPLSPPQQRLTRKGIKKKHRGFTASKGLHPHLKNWNLEISVEGGALSNSSSFVWLWHMKEFQPFMHHLCSRHGGTVAGSRKMQREMLLVQRRHKTTAFMHSTCMEGQMKCFLLFLQRRKDLMSWTVIRKVFLIFEGGIGFADMVKSPF